QVAVGVRGGEHGQRDALARGGRGRREREQEQQRLQHGAAQKATVEFPASTSFRKRTRPAVYVRWSSHIAMWLPSGQSRKLPCLTCVETQRMCSGSMVSWAAPITRVGTVIVPREALRSHF